MPGGSVELFLELLLMLPVLVSHDVQNGISYDFNFVRLHERGVVSEAKGLKCTIKVGLASQKLAAMVTMV